MKFFQKKQAEKKSLLKSLLSLQTIIIVGIGIPVLFSTFLLGYIHAGKAFVPPHFHANFAVYIDGDRLDFSDDIYMEDVAGCSLTGEMQAEDRVHLHENNGETIHVHHDGAAWGHFFSNLGYNFGETYLVTDKEVMYSNTGSSIMHFYLNGEKISNPHNKNIGSMDRLLIAYGDYSFGELLAMQDEVSSNAGEYNMKYDPGSCAGTNENSIGVLLRDLIHSFHQKKTGHSMKDMQNMDM